MAIFRSVQHVFETLPLTDYPGHLFLLTSSNKEERIRFCTKIVNLSFLESISRFYRPAKN